MNGHIYVSRVFQSKTWSSSRILRALQLLFTLVTRERETLQLIAEGRAEKEIAFMLNISSKTVGFHRENIKRKLGLRTTAQLTRYAIEQRLI